MNITETETEIKIGDAIKFKRDNGSLYEGWIMWFHPDGRVQVSDNREMKCQNFVINKNQIVCKVPFPFSSL